MVSEKIKELTIGPMTSPDIPAVLTIECSSFTMPWSYSSFFNETKNLKSIPRVARLGDRIVGYICASRIIDEGHILTFAVDPEFRRLGIASALIEDMIGHLREEGCRFIFLEVRASNETAKRVYEKFGFRVIGVRKNYYISPVEDAIAMVLKFT